MHSHEDDVGDALLDAEVVDLVARIADAVVTADVEGGVLLAEAAHRLTYDGVIA